MEYANNLGSNVFFSRVALAKVILGLFLSMLFWRGARISWLGWFGVTIGAQYGFRYCLFWALVTASTLVVGVIGGSCNFLGRTLPLTRFTLLCSGLLASGLAFLAWHMAPMHLFRVFYFPVSHNLIGLEFDGKHITCGFSGPARSGQKVSLFVIDSDGKQIQSNNRIIQTYESDNGSLKFEQLDSEQTEASSISFNSMGPFVANALDYECVSVFDPELQRTVVKLSGVVVDVIAMDESGQLLAIGERIHKPNQIIDQVKIEVWDLTRALHDRAVAVRRRSAEERRR